MVAPRQLIFGLCLCLALILPGHGFAAQSQATVDFQTWLADFKRQALAAGISESTFDEAFEGVQPLERVLESDRKQPEFTRTFWSYLDRGVNDKRIARGRALLVEHADLLAEMERRYGVQPRFLVAFWGLESNFGDYTGKIPVIAALATLAYDPRRADFFRAQLLYALEILEAGHIAPETMKGSWAGAMGQLQFIPSTFVSYATDGDGNGRIDIWGSLPDVFASAANYLSSIGWRGDETWGREVQLPEGFDFNQIGPEQARQIAEWQALGVRRADGRDLPSADIVGAILLPAGAKGPAFLVYHNYERILEWNRSMLYALAVGHLADRLVGRPPLMAARPVDERPLSRAEVEEMQTILNGLGFDTGEPDGVVGSLTRSAIQSYQRVSSLPPDGYPTAELLDKLRRTAEN